MEINAANVAWHKFFCGKPSFVDKKMDEKETNLASCLQKEMQQSTDIAVPVKTKRP